MYVVSYVGDFIEAWLEVGVSHVYATGACLKADDYTRLPTAHTRVRILLDQLLWRQIEFQRKIVDLKIYLEIIFVHTFIICSTSKQSFFKEPDLNEAVFIHLGTNYKIVEVYIYPKMHNLL
jgi:hypothetical protein